MTRIQMSGASLQFLLAKTDGPTTIICQSDRQYPYYMNCHCTMYFILEYLQELAAYMPVAS
jgi:hypothetical protein